MEWCEVDLEAATWTIPATKLKRSVGDKQTADSHVVPLSLQAASIWPT